MKKQLWHRHPHDTDTFLAEVPGGVLVRVVEQRTSNEWHATTTMTFVPGCALANFGIFDLPEGITLTTTP